MGAHAWGVSLAGGPTALVERYNVKEDRWEEQDPLSVPRCGMQLVAVDDFLLAVGGSGSNGDTYLATTERFA